MHLGVFNVKMLILTVYLTMCIHNIFKSLLIKELPTNQY